MPQRRCGWLWPALIVLSGVGYQCLIYSAIGGRLIDSIRIVLAFLPLLALACWIATRARDKVRWSVVLLAAAVAIYALEQRGPRGTAMAYGAPHAAIYLSLLWLFARTLRRGQEPLITRLARRVHGTLPPALSAYTRRVTAAWCVFFAAQIVVSALLFGFASLGHWSLFINVLNFPLLALMFIGEYAYRLIRHGDFPHASLLDGVRAFSSDAKCSTAAGCPGSRT